VLTLAKELDIVTDPVAEVVLMSRGTAKPLDSEPSFAALCFPAEGSDPRRGDVGTIAPYTLLAGRLCLMAGL
jgi:hypothetical protein